ncbi:MAG: DsbC family protein [Thermodesulfobacteriota bacterium]|nr:DsbC family protein [Thermodesulfobacteriota bacterium]
MSRFILSLLLLLSFLSLSACAGQQQEGSNDISAALSSYYPQIKYQLISPTPVAGVYEIVGDNGEILYFVPASGHMFFGELWSADAQNLTRNRENQRLSAKRKEFPLDQAIKIGDGPNQVIEVTDPDCPFCRQSSDFFAGRDDVTRYVFLLPLDQIHPHAAAKSRYILAAEDQELAYEEVFGGKYDRQPIPAVNDNGLLDLHRKVAGKIGINGTPRFWINGQHIAGYNPQQFEKLLNK